MLDWERRGCRDGQECRVSIMAASAQEDVGWSGKVRRGRSHADPGPDPRFALHAVLWLPLYVDVAGEIMRRTGKAESGPRGCAERNRGQAGPGERLPEQLEQERKTMTRRARRTCASGVDSQRRAVAALRKPDAGGTGAAMRSSAEPHRGRAAALIECVVQNLGDAGNPALSDPELTKPTPGSNQWPCGRR